MVVSGRPCPTANGHKRSAMSPNIPGSRRPKRRSRAIRIQGLPATEAKLPITPVIGTSPCLDPIDVAVLDPHAVAHSQVEVARLFDDQ
jgi:hypothetical protein